MKRSLVPTLAVLCLAASACSSAHGTTQDALGFHGVEPQPAPARPEFVLHDTSGKTYDFDKQTAGRPTYLYFGYTHCPDLCPTAMADLASALRQSSPAMRAKAIVVFVSTDPKRDSDFVIRRWLNQFSTTFVGLVGTQAQLTQAQNAVGVEAAEPGPIVPTIAGHPDEHVHAPGTAPHKHFGPLGYSVSHSAVIFAYDADDRLPVLYPGGVTPSDIANDLPILADPAILKH